MKVILVGNQNSGKSTLFNKLTRGSAPVGNRAGVTVKTEEKRVVGTDITVCDLPGTYSLSPLTSEETITCERIKNVDNEVIACVLDSTALSRSLLLTLDVCASDKPVVVVLNMCDKAEKEGLTINEKALEKLLQRPVVKISAATGQGLKELIEVLKSADTLPFRPLSFSGEGKKSLFTDAVFQEVVKGKKRSISDKIDKIVLNKYLSLPIFAVVMLITYSLSVGFFGKAASDLISYCFSLFSEKLRSVLLSANVSKAVVGLTVDAGLKGISSVIAFLPQIAALYFSLSVLENSGYMSRAAFLFERLFASIGLSGKSLIPFIVGTGCSVPAILSTRTIVSRREKTLTAMLTPFVPCGAKLPMIALFADFFFSDTRGLTAFSFYFSCVVVMIFSAVLFKLIFPEKDEFPFIYELTDYRLPDIKSAAKETLYKTLSFVKRVGTVVFISSVIVWALSSFNLSFSFTDTPDESVLACIGRLLSPVLYPVLGVNSWQATVCALQGIIAKEQVVSSMAVLAGAENAELFSGAAFGFFDKASAYSFVMFNLLSPPCIGAISALKRETSLKVTVFTLFYQTAVAIAVPSLLRLLLVALFY